MLCFLVARFDEEDEGMDGVLNRAGSHEGGLLAQGDRREVQSEPLRLRPEKEITCGTISES
jgi:hypothetical protein